MSAPQIKPLTLAEKAWVTDEVGNAHAVVNEYSPGDAGGPLTPEVLDRAFRAAYFADSHDSNHANTVINAIGMAFGQYLVEQLGFSWVAAFNEHGGEVAVLALPGKGDVLVFPPNLVAKRWANGTTDFLDHVFHGIKEQLANVEAGWRG